MKVLPVTALVAAFAFNIVTAHAGAMSARTRTIIFNPQTMRVTQTLRGSCWTTSIASRRSNAYRCTVGNGIHDPCFALDAKTVACPTNPAANRGIRIALTKSVPPSSGPTGRNPWMLQMANGATCNVGTGTVIPGYPFYCSTGLVCAAPSTKPAGSFISVQCGRPRNGLQVAGSRRYGIAVMYE
jgi:hypothetical protein